LLIRREDGQVSETGRRELSALIPLLSRFTLLEFKGPTDSLGRGDFAHLVGCAFLWHGQQRELVNYKDVSLIVLAPMITEPFREELQGLGCEASQEEAGVFRIVGLPFTIWLVETDVMADRGQPILSLVSRLFLKDRRRIIRELARSHENALLRYMMQFVEQPTSLDEGFIMQGLAEEDRKAIREDIVRAILEEAPVEWRLEGVPPEERVRGLPAEERVRGLPAEDRLHGLPAEERVRGLTFEERLAGLSEEELARILDLVMRKQGT
jgi:hypothetical protein